MHRSIRQTVYPAFKELTMLEQLEAAFEEETGLNFFEAIGLDFNYWPDDDNVDYDEEPMPVDMVLLARTIHPNCNFAFLTDFSTVDDLSNAPIIQYESIGLDKHAILIAHNFNDFLRLLISTDSIWSFLLENDVSPEVYEAEDRVVHKRIMDRFQLEPIDSIRAYKEQLKASRDKEAVIQTYNGLGVKVISDAMTHASFIVDERDNNDQTKEKLLSFMVNASIESCLAYLRDVQEGSYTGMPAYVETHELLIDILERFGFTNEAKRLKRYG